MAGKQRIFLAVAFLFGVPAIVTTVLLGPSAHHEIVDGAQPGGTLRGSTRDEAGRALAGIDVGAFAVGPGRVPLASTKSGENGAFEIDVPPVQRGHYELVAGGGERLLQAIAVSELDHSGKVVAIAPVEFRLGPASRLDIDFVRDDKSPAGEGTFTLEGPSDAGFFASWRGERLERSGFVHAGRLSLDSLPPVRVRLQVRMASGERIDLMLELEPGQNGHRVKL